MNLELLKSCCCNIKTMLYYTILQLREDWFYSLVKVASFEKTPAGKPNRGVKARVLFASDLTVHI